MRIITINEIANVFGVTPKTINEWQADGFPVAVRGERAIPSEFETAECIKWLVAREVHKVRGEDPKNRLHRLQGDDLEMKLGIARGALVRVDEVEPAIKAAIVTARERVRRAPAGLAIQMEGLDTAAREALLRDMFDDVLGKLTQWRSQGADEAEEDGLAD